MRMLMMAIMKKRWYIVSSHNLKSFVKLHKNQWPTENILRLRYDRLGDHAIDCINSRLSVV